MLAVILLLATAADVHIAGFSHVARQAPCETGWPGAACSGARAGCVDLAFERCR